MSRRSGSDPVDVSQLAEHAARIDTLAEQQQQLRDGQLQLVRDVLSGFESLDTRISDAINSSVGDAVRRAVEDAVAATTRDPLGSTTGGSAASHAQHSARPLVPPLHLRHVAKKINN